MAIDPIYISLTDVEEFTSAGGEAALSSDDRARLERARSAPAIEYDIIRPLKARALRAAFERFEAVEWTRNSARASELREFIAREGWWLNDYALFRALHTRNEARYWLEWDVRLRDRVPVALEEASRELAREILYYSWVQWVADAQWQRARQECGNVGIFGDFPFVVSGDSADVWSRQHEFRVKASVGVPPDAFSATGQDWGLPAYRWDVMERDGYEWLRQRARRCTELYDGFRLDHLVGFYRTFVREPDGRTAFVPPDEDVQLAQGERLLELFYASGATIVVEDLGTVPDFVRASLARLEAPGLKVMRWEREWNEDGQPFRDPAQYPPRSVATSGTHDTQTLADWWDAADADERARAMEIPGLRRFGFTPLEPYSAGLRDAFLEVLFAAGSDYLLLPMQDVFGWRDRVNTPAVVAAHNWTWRLPWAVDAVLSDDDALERARFLRRAADRHRRGQFR
jgi:4-alpha-glucanotransferase